MRKNNMRTPKEKEKILKEIYMGKIGRNEICRKYNIYTHTLSSWRSKYDRDGLNQVLEKIKKDMMEHGFDLAKINEIFNKYLNKNN